MLSMEESWLYLMTSDYCRYTDDDDYDYDDDGSIYLSLYTLVITTILIIIIINIIIISIIINIIIISIIINIIIYSSMHTIASGGGDLGD